jgi:hypothetical protein
MCQQPELLKEYLRPQLDVSSIPPIPFHPEVGELEEGLTRLVTVVQYFHQLVTPIPNITPLGQEMVVMRLEHILHTTGISFPAYLIHDTACFLHALLYKINAHTTGAPISLPSTSFIPDGSFGEDTPASPETSSPASQVSVASVYVRPYLMVF